MFKHTILLLTGTIYSVDWYNDLIVTGSGDNGIRVVDASTEKIVWKHDEAHKGDVNCVRWSPDGMCISNFGSVSSDISYYNNNNQVQCLQV